MDTSFIISIKRLLQISVFSGILVMGLFIGDILSFKEMITLEVFISMFFLIGGLVVHLGKVETENKLLKSEKDMFSKMVTETTKINSYLIQMGEIADKNIDHPGWKKEWKKFMGTIRKAEDDAKKLFGDINSMLSPDLSPEEQKQKMADFINKAKSQNTFVSEEGEDSKQDKDIEDYTLKELKDKLKELEEKQMFEECTVIKELIELKESQNDEL